MGDSQCLHLNIPFLALQVTNPVVACASARHTPRQSRFFTRFPLACVDTVHWLLAASHMLQVTPSGLASPLGVTVPTTLSFWARYPNPKLRDLNSNQSSQPLTRRQQLPATAHSTGSHTPLFNRRSHCCSVASFKVQSQLKLSIACQTRRTLQWLSPRSHPRLTHQPGVSPCAATSAAAAGLTHTPLP
jgi:hypothetical protein